MLADYLSLPKHNPNATVTSVAQLLSLSTDVTRIVINNGVNESGVIGFDLSGYSRLKRLEIGSNCFINVNQLNLIGLSKLESVVIGENSFTKKKNYHGNDPDRHFYLKDCPKLKSLKMGRYSFSDYKVCEIENVDALEVIEMGDLNEESNNFYSASLQLSSAIVCVE